ncbi:MAG: sodium:proton antiporter [Myxococcota bacterium]|nr:sodium:proton antiporter [Myxococcota bacterium]
MIALAAGVLGQSIAKHLRIPGIVILLGLGVGLGPDGLSWVEPQALGTGLFDIVELAVAVILFEGGMNLELSRLQRSQRAIRRLVTWGAIVTGIGATVAAHELLGWSWLLAAMFGSLVTVTGPTVVGPLVGELRLRPRVATVLEAEGVLIDPIGAILAVLVLEVALAPDTDTLAIGGRAVLMQLGFGAFMGLAGGVLLGGLLRVKRLVPDGYENIVALASVLLLFVASNMVVPHSGILAVPIAGVVVGNAGSRVDRDLREFKDQLSVLLIGLLFVLLAADVRMAEIQSLGAAGALTVAALVFVVRPINVALCTAGSDLTVRERMLVAWVAPRGIVAAAVASISAVGMADHGMAGGDALRAMVFLTIAGTVVLAGFTAKPLAVLLGVRLPGRDTVGILGIPGLGLMLGEALRDAGQTIVFLDANPQHCRQAEDAGFNVVFGNALQDRTLQRARFELVGTTIGVTGNDALNRSFVTTAAEHFNVPRGLAAQRRDDVDSEVEGLFKRPHDVERWDVRIRHDMVVKEEWQFVAEPEPAPEPESEPTGMTAVRSGERFVLLFVTRGKRGFPTTRSYEPKAGDLVTVVIHTQELEEAHAELRERGFEPASEKPPAQAE